MMEPGRLHILLMTKNVKGVQSALDILMRDVI
jgi:hypothetical protein